MVRARCDTGEPRFKTRQRGRRYSRACMKKASRHSSTAITAKAGDTEQYAEIKTMTGKRHVTGDKVLNF